MPPGLASIAAAMIPYAAVAAGLYVLRSAWWAILLYHAGIVVTLTAAGWDGPLRRARSGWRPGAGAVSALIGALAGTALLALWPLIDATPSSLGDRLAEFGLGRTSWLLFAVYYSTVHPFLEELFWRGTPCGDGVGPHWRDAAFAGYHVPVLWLFVGPVWVGLSFLVLGAISWFWRVSARRFGGSAVVLVSHSVADASIVAAATLIVLRSH